MKVSIHVIQGVLACSLILIGCIAPSGDDDDDDSGGGISCAADGVCPQYQN